MGSLKLIEAVNKIFNNVRDLLQIEISYYSYMIKVKEHHGNRIKVKYVPKS